MPKNRIHIIHHTHWDMEWYFTTHDTNALLNYNLKYSLDHLEKNENESFLFDGQLSPFEDIPKLPKLFSRIKKLVKEDKLKVGPWYSQPDLRLTSDEGIYRNYHYGQELAGMKSNKYNYLYTPDTFGFGENIPTIYNSLNKKWAVLWRGVDRKSVKNAPVFKWKAQNGESVLVYNIGSGYFVGRYLYNDQTLESLYKNNILPSIKRQMQNGKYSVVAIPSGGDQQPYNSDIKNAIKKLNAKKDGNEYILSSWKQFFRELEPQVKNIPEYTGSHTLAYGGRLHKLVGAHRADIKKILYSTEMKISRVLEPLLLMSPLSRQYYPELEMDKMWKNILLSQAHDAYASCNSDVVNTNIKNRLLESENMYRSNKDLILRFIGENYKDNQVLVVNPTQFSGKKLFELEIATKTKKFRIQNKNNDVDFIITSQKINKGLVKVVYTADGEVEKKLPDIYISKIKMLTNVKRSSIHKLSVIESTDKWTSKNKEEFKVEFKDGDFIITKANDSTKMNINFHLDGGDSYDLDLYKDVKPFTLKDAKVKRISKIQSGNISVSKYSLEIKLPKTIKGWKMRKSTDVVRGEINFTSSNRFNINYKFNNLVPHLLIQPTLTQNHSDHNHNVLSQNGYITRENKVIVDKSELPNLRELPTDFDFMHGNVVIGNISKLSIFSLDVREYKINNNKIFFNLLRTPDVLGRPDLKIRPGRASGLSDKIVTIPKSTSELNNETFSINLDFNLSKQELTHVIDEMVLNNMAFHKQGIYKYYSNVNSWTLPNISTNKNLSKTIILSNKNIVVQASFKSRGYYYLRVNNPLSKQVSTSIQFFGKTYKNVIIKPNESKTYKIKAQRTSAI